MTTLSRFRSVFVTAASILLGATGVSFAEGGPVSASPIGKVVSAKGAVTIQSVNAVIVQAVLGNQARFAKAGDPIFVGDIVQTGRDGSVAIAFNDDTVFNLSSNARMEMTKYIYDPHSDKNSTLLSLTKGTFSFVAGAVAKTGDMKIDTPVATMGIRGTTPRVEISENGTVKFSTLVETGRKKILQNSSRSRKAEWRQLNHSELASKGPNPAPQRKEKKINFSICNRC